MLKPQPLTDEARAFRGLNIESIEGTVLATIINPKVRDVAKMKAGPARTVPYRSLKKALTEGSGRHFILECKKSSPTLGDFCKDFSLDRLLACYESRASAISVLCEEHFFKGSLDYLRYVRERTSLPVICKDFVIDEVQLEAAASAGADAVLLMLSLLTRERFLELYAKARELGLEVLCEVDTKEDALFARDHRIPVVGINNRNLRILKIDLQKARDLAPIFGPETTVVSESGITSHEALLSMAPINAFLIGSALSGADDVFFAANTMLYGTNKLCGITTDEALDAALEGHAAICGLIFAEKSPRCVSLEFAKRCVKRGHPQTRFAAVFVDEDPGEIARIVRETGCDYVQLHGAESPECIAKIRALLPDAGIIKAVKIRQQSDFEACRAYAPLCDFLLLDSKAPGSGTSFDWNAIPDYIDRARTLISGGIGLENLRDALALGFAGVDMNSRLEGSRGVKDPDMVRKAFGIIKEF
jgi:indole-3-glycerol phosphate synthase/phosphoribosylanthranilate isomerase